MRLQSKKMKKGPFKSSGKCDPEKQTLAPYDTESTCLTH